MFLFLCKFHNFYILQEYRAYVEYMHMYIYTYTYSKIYSKGLGRFFS